LIYYLERKTMTKSEEFLKSFGLIKGLYVGPFHLDVGYDVYTDKPKVSLWTKGERVENSPTDEFGILELITSAIEDESYYVRDEEVNLTEIEIWDDIDEDDGSIMVVLGNDDSIEERKFVPTIFGKDFCIYFSKGDSESPNRVMAIKVVDGNCLEVSFDGDSTIKFSDINFEEVSWGEVKKLMEARSDSLADYVKSHSNEELTSVYTYLMYCCRKLDPGQETLQNEIERFNEKFICRHRVRSIFFEAIGNTILSNLKMENLKDLFSKFLFLDTNDGKEIDIFDKNYTLRSVIVMNK
jgi:hypothetical protein